MNVHASLGSATVHEAAGRSQVVDLDLVHDPGYERAADRAAPVESAAAEPVELAAGHRIRRARGAGRATLAPDTSLLVDASVLLGADFRPPRELHP